jgi:hypothetical protein
MRVDRDGVNLGQAERKYLRHAVIDPDDGMMMYLHEFSP